MMKLKRPLKLTGGQVQTAYRILVAGSREKLDADVGDQWDSGQVQSDRSVNVAYEGKPGPSGPRSHSKSFASPR